MRCSWPIGGGGLISGVANYIKAVRPEIKVIGVQTERLRRHGAVGRARRARGAARCRACSPTARPSSWWAKKPSAWPRAWSMTTSTVDTDAVCAAIKDIFVDTRSIVEPSGALAVAAIKQYVAKHKTKGETYAAILCGANMNFDRLRFVAERAEVGEEREALLAVTIPEERGSFKRFCEVVGKLPGGPRSVTEFNYRISHENKAHVFVGPDHAHQGRERADRRRTSRDTALKRST